MNQQTNIAGIPITIVDVLYIGLLIFFAYQAIKAERLLKKLEEPKYVYRTKSRGLNVVLTVIIAIFGILTFIMQKAYITGSIMVILSFFFLLSSRTKVVVAKNGFFADNRLIRWDQFKRWAWDTKGGNLVIITKQFGKPEQREVLRVGRVNMTEINERIRFFKLGKNSTLLEEVDAAEKDVIEETEDGKIIEGKELAPPEPAKKQGLAGTGKSAGKKGKGKKKG